MNVLAVWLGSCLKKCVALFASKGAGTFFKAKSTKRNEIPQKGQFNIMVGYNQQNLLTKKREVKNTPYKIKRAVISHRPFSHSQNFLSSRRTFANANSIFDTANNKRASAMMVRMAA